VIKCQPYILDAFLVIHSKRRRGHLHPRPASGLLCLGVGDFVLPKLGEGGNPFASEMFCCFWKARSLPVLGCPWCSASWGRSYQLPASWIIPVK